MTAGASTPASGLTRGERTRARLLAAGGQVFAERGYHSARVDDVVRLAKTSHGTFYTYFSSKEALFDALVEEVAERLAAVVDELPTISNSVAGRAELRRWLTRYVALSRESGAIVQAWTEAELSGRPVGRRGGLDLGGLAATLEQRLRIPKRSGLDATVATLALAAMVERLCYFVETRQVLASDDEVCDVLADVIIAACFG